MLWKQKGYVNMQKWVKTTIQILISVFSISRNLIKINDREILKNVGS